MKNRLVIIGIGLIGGSFGLAARRAGLAREIIGVARRDSTIEAAIKVGACDAATSDVCEAAKGADLVLLAPPVGQMEQICREIAPLVAPGAIVTDAGSTKAEIVARCEPLFTRAHFIGGHPMAGSEQTGVEAARADLFEGAKWILTPNAQTDAGALGRLTEIIERMGAQVLPMDAQQHDETLAVTSHLPHMTAAALVHVFGDLNDENAARVVASGWRDSTRIAAGGAPMWRDIALANRAALLNALDEMDASLGQFRAALESENGDEIEVWLETAAKLRREF